MTQSASVFHLKVQRIEQVCLFELSWGRGQQLGVTLPYPEVLNTLYKEWSSVYLSFYKTALRGRVAAKGSILPPPVDWHAKLVQAEAKLLYEFHHWLRRAELYEIRSRLAQAARDGEVGSGDSPVPTVDVFLTCNPLDLERLPWEAWEIGTEFAATGKIRFFRKPLNIVGATVTPQRRRRRARILAILGDDTGLNFQADREAVRSLNSIANIEFVGWQPGQDIPQLKTEISDAIADARGWDVLFFAGHSNETDLTGGELGIAPGVSLNLREIAQSLTVAKEQGLQFAIFNSCNGLSLANALINLGLSQVAVMREPVHNQVAQEFLVRFLQRLGEYKDVHEALQYACQYLKLEKPFTYPSTYLIPSLFRHPDAPLFRIEPYGIKQQLKRWLPTRKEAIALAALGLVSWQLSVQGFLLDRRVLVQSEEAQLTNQVEKTQPPPVLLVEIDNESIRKGGISEPNPMDRSYLADLVTKLAAINAKVVGIDYLLDRYQKENDQKLAKALHSSVQQQATWFVFAIQRHHNTGGWFEVLPELAKPSWSLQGDVLVLGSQLRYMTLVPRDNPDPRNMPLAYMLALSHWLNFDQSQACSRNPSPTNIGKLGSPTSVPSLARESALSKPSCEHFGKLPQPQLYSSADWFSQLTTYVTNTTGQDYRHIFSPTARLQPLTNQAYLLRQMWLHPIIDYSIPPEQVYKRLPAWKLLESPVKSLKLDSQQQPVVIIAAGGYDEAGVAAEGTDNFPLPPPVGYWRSQENPPDPRQIFPGGEAHAYMIHHFLNQRLVVPIPDFWLVGVAVLLGKGTALALERIKGERKNRQGKIWLFVLPSGRGKWLLLLSGTTAVYGLASLQLYITAAVLMPWLLPVSAFWTFVFLGLLEGKSHA